MVRVGESSQLKTISFAGQSASVANASRDSNVVCDNFFRDFCVHVLTAVQPTGGASWFCPTQSETKLRDYFLNKIPFKLGGHDKNCSEKNSKHTPASL